MFRSPHFLAPRKALPEVWALALRAPRGLGTSPKCAGSKRSVQLRCFTRGCATGSKRSERAPRGLANYSTHPSGAPRGLSNYSTHPSGSLQTIARPTSAPAPKCTTTPSKVTPGSDRAPSQRTFAEVCPTVNSKRSGQLLYVNPSGSLRTIAPSASAPKCTTNPRKVTAGSNRELQEVWPITVLHPRVCHGLQEVCGLQEVWALTPREHRTAARPASAPTPKCTTAPGKVTTGSDRTPTLAEVCPMVVLPSWAPGHPLDSKMSGHLHSPHTPGLIMPRRTATRPPRHPLQSAPPLPPK
jgi:hypothetical protein